MLLKLFSLDITPEITQSKTDQVKTDSKFQVTLAHNGLTNKSKNKKEQEKEKLKL